MHLAAYYSAAVSNVAGIHNVPSVNDGYLANSDDGLVLPRPALAIGSYAAATVLNRMFFDHQTWRDIGPSELRIVGAAITAPGSFAFNFDGHPTFQIPEGGSFKLYYERGTLGASSVLCGLMMVNGVGSRVNRPFRSIRFTTSHTSAAGVWVETVMTPAQPLPSGRYGVVGIAAIGTAGGFARLRFKNQQNMPGCFCVNSIAATNNPFLRNTIAGMVGTFTESTIPDVQFISLTSGAVTYTVLLDLVKL